MYKLISKISLTFLFLALTMPYGVYAYAFTQTLQKGSSSNEVADLQKALKADPAIYPEGMVTGYFGALTEKAVQRFQAKYGIVNQGDPLSTGYGLIGKRTRTKLNEIFGQAVNTNPSSPITTPVSVPVSNPTQSDNGKGGGPNIDGPVPDGFTRAEAGHVFSSNLPVPKLVYVNTESTIRDGQKWKIYVVSVSNWQEYPDDLFALEPRNVLGAKQGFAPHTQVAVVRNTGSGIQVWKYAKPQDLSRIELDVLDSPDWSPPSSVYIKLLQPYKVIESNVVHIPLSGGDMRPNLKISSVWSSGNNVYVSACNRGGGDAPEFTYRLTKLDMPQFVIDKVKIGGLKGGECMTETAVPAAESRVESGKSYLFRAELDITNTVQESIETDNSIENQVTIVF